MASPLATRIAEEHAAASAALPEEVVSRDRRRSAIERLKVEGLPTSRDENWKYANLRPLEKVRFAPAAAGAAIAARAAGEAPAASPPRAAEGASATGGRAPTLSGEPGAALTVADLPPPIEGYARYTFVDGVFAPALSAPVIKAGISVASLRSSAAELGGLAVGSNPAPATKQTAVTAIGSAENTAAKDARFALLNDAFAVDGVAIHVSAGIDCPTCIELVFVASAEAQAGSSYPRVELHVAKDARLGLIERHVSIGGTGANFINAAVKVDLARGATLNHYRVQESGSKAIWFDTLSAVLAQDATYKLHGVSVGGQSSRSTITVQLAGERADARVSVASLGDRQQIQDAFVLIEHTAPNTRSEQTFRGIAAGRARVAFNGKVVVRKGAQGTDSQQSLRGLLAGPEAEIDVRPQLEIYTDDVRCAHGATTGKLDDNMLFYLLSRGIDRATAQRLLKWAFLEDVVARIEVPELRRQIERSLAGQMQEAAELKELL